VSVTVKFGVIILKTLFNCFRDMCVLERSDKYQRRGTQNLNSAFACTVTLHYPRWVLYQHCASSSSSSSPSR